MKRFWIGAPVLVSAAALATHHILLLQNRLATLEEAPRVEPHSVLRLQGELKATRAELTGEVSRTRNEFLDEAQADRSRILAIEAQLGAASDKLHAQRTRLASWEERWGSRPDEIEARLHELNERLEREADEIDELVSMSQEQAEVNQATLTSMLAPLAVTRDTDQMWKELVGPVVQISGDTTVGSGILLESNEIGSTGAWRTRILTSWHVIRDVYSAGDRERTVPIKLYRPDGTYEMESGRLLDHNVELDVALMVLTTERHIAYGARLAPRSRLEQVKIFDRVYVVGCPLGNDPIPTAGEVASVFHEVDGENYWMISAPTYIGNSGGGIFDADTHELIGVFSKIYTHGSLRSNIVPHMGLATPLPEVYEWFRESGFGELEPAAAEPHVAAIDTDF